jgi:hypothetical protein
MFMVLMDCRDFERFSCALNFANILMVSRLFFAALGCIPRIDNVHNIYLLNDLRDHRFPLIKNALFFIISMQLLVLPTMAYLT